MFDLSVCAREHHDDNSVHLVLTMTLDKCWMLSDEASYGIPIDEYHKHEQHDAWRLKQQNHEVLQVDTDV